MNLGNPTFRKQNGHAKHLGRFFKNFFFPDLEAGRMSNPGPVSPKNFDTGLH
jgi:hypothetical protein